MNRPGGALTIDEVLAAARAGLRRLNSAEAKQAVDAGALLVDIRPQAQRQAEGHVPGAAVVERNVLEWRFDPQSADRLPVASYDLQIIVLCSEGYTSSLAAAALQELGIWRATDLAGGFRAWQAAGLPVTMVPSGYKSDSCTASAPAGPESRGAESVDPESADPESADPESASRD